MNKDNLLKMADYIETIPQELFDMDCSHRVGNRKRSKCQGIGDILGHCTILDNGLLPLYEDGFIDFITWSEEFTEIGWISNSNEWHFLFWSEWVYTDNTPTGAAKRIRYLVENGLPENWMEIIEGEDPIPY